MKRALFILCILLVSSTIIVIETEIAKADTITIYPPSTPRDFTSNGHFFSCDGFHFITVNNTMNFSSIYWGTNYMEFNDTKFFISGPNRVNVSLAFIHSDPQNANNDEKIYGFWAETSSGMVYINVSNLNNGVNYKIKQDGSIIETVQANLSGFVSISCDSWSEHHFEIFQLGSAAGINITSPYPVDEAIEKNRPPTNMSAYVECSDADVYILFKNLTSYPDTWTIAYSWLGVSDGRYAMSNLASGFSMLEFIWGNTEYTWSVNVSNGSGWYVGTIGATTFTLNVDDTLSTDCDFRWWARYEP